MTHMKKKISAFIILFLFLAVPLFAEELPELPKGPLNLTQMIPEQFSAEYWIHRLPHANDVLKTPEELKTFNEEILAVIPERKDIFKLKDTLRGKDIRDVVGQAYDTVAGRILYDAKGVRIPKSFFETEVKPLIQLDAVSSKVNIRWGAAVRPASVRALPTHVKMLEEVGDIEFDQLQFTLIKLWTPVAIYHESKDGLWYYVQAPYVRGWVQSKDIAVFPSEQALKEKVKSKSFLVVTAESAWVCADAACKSKLQKPTMGTILPLVDKTDNTYVVAMLSRKESGNVFIRDGHVKKKSDVREDFPPFTQASVIRQAFKLLGARYGWGGMYNGRDCSGFTHDVFLSMGVDMPRDSKQQAFIGTQLGSFEPYKGAKEKAAILDQLATPGITLLKMPHHMMLYIGEIDGNFYVIHSTWAERISMTSDEKRRINQVVVTDLSLNGHSYLGGLFERIVQINEVN